MMILKNIFQVNLIGHIILTQYISRLMIRVKSGCVINITSIASEIPDIGTLAYGSSKAAFSRASRSMATELGAFNIRVNAISPGLTNTDMLHEMDSNAQHAIIQSTALKRIAEPTEIANVALFLASDLSTYITGQTIRVDGGLV